MPSKYLSPDLERSVDCTCSLESVHPTDTDPPEVVINPDCPEHGWRDADRDYDEWRDRMDEESREKGYDHSREGLD